MERDEVRERIYAKIDELPTLPAVLPKLLSLMDSRDSSAGDIADAISRDPALTSKILKAANSAYYGFSQTISSLDNAVPLLGFNMVKSMAVSIGVINTLPAGGKSDHFSREGLWIHSLAVATVMQELVRRTGRTDNSDYLFIVGLLHDIGKVVYDEFFSELFQQVLEETAALGKAEIHIAERRIIGTDHGEAGAILLNRWRFPAVISDAIAVHHNGGVPEGVSDVDVAMLRVSDALPQELGMGDVGNPAPPEIPGSDLDRLGIDDKSLEDTRAHLKNAEEGIYAFFSAMG